MLEEDKLVRDDLVGRATFYGSAGPSKRKL